MKTKQIFAGLIGASMLCSMGAAAAAANVQQPQEKLPITEEKQQAPERVLTYGTIESIQKENGMPASIVLSRPKEDGGTVVLRLRADTILFDSGAGVQADWGTLKEGDSIYAFHSPVMTHSLPPQTTAEAILTNIPQDAGAAMLHTVKEVEQTADGGLRILADQGDLIISVGKDAVISPLDTKNKVSLADVKVGDRIFAWYDMVLESYPGQTHTDKLVLIPAGMQIEEPVQRAYHIVIDGDMMLPQKAVVKNEVVMVPLRAAAEALGCKVTWDGAEKAATITDDARTMTVTIGEDLYVSAAAPETDLIGMTAPQKLGAAPYIDAEGYTWVPAKAFEVMVGYQVTQTEDAVKIDPQS
ncbi:MAG: hypothetical protein KH319_00720 [Butyricicoccus pullicaecorum]|jgi:hypothetical protein|nr:hypothetical protein [Butyricicoccus pullicaecorum]